MMNCRWIVVVSWLLFAVSLASAAEPAVDADAALARQFRDEVAPFLQTNCVACHDSEKQEAKLDLAPFDSVAKVTAGHQIWEIVLERLEAGEMPPEDARKQPTADERKAVTAWIRAVRKREADRNAGDPGVVLARRLSNAEYNYTLRDLLGVDLRPTREFPVDPANEAGFDNSGESLAMSPALLNKYVAAAREVADHLVLKPEGFDFAPHPVATDTDRDKYCVKRIVDFYLRQPTDLAAYFETAWRYQHRTALGQPEATLEALATEARVSPKYLATVWSALTGEAFDIGPMAKLQAMWRELPALEANMPQRETVDRAAAGCRAMRDYVLKLRRKLEPQIDGLQVRGIHEGAQCFVLWKNDQYAKFRRNYDPAKLQVDGEPLGEKREPDPDLTVPADEAERREVEASLARFCDVFPDAFFVSERGRDYVGKPREQQEKGRLLSAGFHSMMGYYRDDQPLYDLVLSEDEQREIDRLWQELDFIASAPHRQYQGFVWFERTDSRWMRDAEFDFARAEDKDVTSEDKVTRLAQVYRDKAIDAGARGESLQAIDDFFETINAQIRWVESARLAAEPTHLAAMLKFAERAYRRPLSGAEREDLLAFYREQRAAEATHEEAVQDVLVLVLMSPHFLYRMDLADEGEGLRPLTDYELASRLSYFLWSSLPDEELLAHAAARDLHESGVLLAQTRRMLGDERVRGLAVEFGGNWLDFRRFESHNSVDRERFPAFTNDLRQAMFEEPVRYLLDAIQNDRSARELLYGRHTFVNPVLAAHYGITNVSGGPDDWVRIDDAEAHGRGGLLPMAVFMTQNAPGLRTSPVKRGYWVVRRLLGERIPPPPPNVPELPADEAKLGELTLREALAKHRDHVSCAGCHERFDSFGLTFEGFGPIGEARELDLGGRPVDTRAVFPGGREGTGLAGLQTYLQHERQEDFLDHLCRSLLSYALGRTLLPSDDSTIEAMRRDIAAQDERLHAAIEAIVTSRQFLTKRGSANVAAAPPPTEPASVQPPASTQPPDNSASDNPAQE
jgi:mono/diheme cytochrome c family protein